MPNLVKVLIKGLLYCYSLHYCVRSLWKLMAQRSPAIVLMLYVFLAELMFCTTVQPRSLILETFCLL